MYSMLLLVVSCPLGLASARVKAYNHCRTWAHYEGYRNLWYQGRILGLALVYFLINKITVERYHLFKILFRRLMLALM